MKTSLTNTFKYTVVKTIFDGDMFDEEIFDEDIVQVANHILMRTHDIFDMKTFLINTNFFLMHTFLMR